MNTTLKEKLQLVNDTLAEAEKYEHACHVLEFDKETICPSKAMEEQGEVSAFLSNKAFTLLKQQRFIDAAEYLYVHKDELEEFDRTLAESLHRDYLRTKNITPEMDHEFSLTFNRAFVNWLNAKQSADFSKFAKSLAEVREVNLKQISLTQEAKPVPYDNLLNNYERGMTCKDLDDCFGKCKERLVPLLKKITSSKKKIRTDFLSRTVTDEQQKEMATYLLHCMGFDFERGSFTTTEHPFTDGLARNDIRVTTHYYPTQFASSMFSIIHEGGHALFEQNQPQQNYDHFINNEKTMGQHESVSRFYENRIGRSKAFIHLIYPEAKRIFPQVFCDVSENEFYEAMNVVQPSLIRTEADEFTYTFHIIIRYEIEKALINGKSLDIASLPSIWNDKYEQYLGIRPANDREGILQDVHWASGFGYFSAYALGNMYNAMYYNRMAKDINIDETIRSGKITVLNDWMKEHVFKKADREDARTWIQNITGREFTADDFLTYLEEKYSELYEL
jgi:carboxypeptidase Taq